MTEVGDAAERGRSATEAGLRHLVKEVGTRGGRWRRRIREDFSGNRDSVTDFEAVVRAIALSSRGIQDLRSARRASV